MSVWWQDVMREATYQGHHTSVVVEAGFRYGMILFGNMGRLHGLEAINKQPKICTLTFMTSASMYSQFAMMEVNFHLSAPGFMLR